MARLPKLESGKTARKIDDLIEIGDGGLIFMLFLVVLGTLFTGLIAPFVEENPMYFIFLISPAIWIIGTVIWIRNTAEIKHYTHFRDARFLMDKLAGHDLQVAAPLISAIYSHSVDDHPGETGNSCRVCRPRVELIESLVRDKHTDHSDVEYAKLYLEERKSIGGIR